MWAIAANVKPARRTGNFILQAALAPGRGTFGAVKSAQFLVLPTFESLEGLHTGWRDKVVEVKTCGSTKIKLRPG